MITKGTGRACEANQVLQSICVSNSFSEGVAFFMGRMFVNFLMPQQEDTTKEAIKPDPERWFLRKVFDWGLIGVETLIAHSLYEELTSCVFQGILCQTHIVAVIATTYQLIDRKEEQSERAELCYASVFLCTSVGLSILFGGSPILANGIAFLVADVVKEIALSKSIQTENVS